MNFRLQQIFFYIVIIITLAIGLIATHRLYDKSDLPFEYHTDNNKIISGEDYKDIKRGDCITGINDFPVPSEFEVDFFLDTKRIDETVRLTVIDGKGTVKNSSVVLVNFYKNNFFILVSLIIGLSYWLTGVYAIAARPRDKSAKILCLVLITFALAILSTPCYESVSKLTNCFLSPKLGKLKRNRINIPKLGGLGMR